MDAKRIAEGQDSRDNEVRNLDSAEVAEAEQRDRQVEACTGPTLPSCSVDVNRTLVITKALLVLPTPNSRSTTELIRFGAHNHGSS